MVTKFFIHIAISNIHTESEEVCTVTVFNTLSLQFIEGYSNI